MPLLNYLADTNAVSEWMRGERGVVDWMDEHEVEVAISSLTIAELRRGIELKARCEVVQSRCRFAKA